MFCELFKLLRKAKTSQKNVLKIIFNTACEVKCIYRSACISIYGGDLEQSFIKDVFFQHMN